MKTNKNKQWFIKTRGSYLPKTWQGGLVYLIYLAYLIWVLVFVLTNNYKVWPGIFFVVPNWIAACAIVSWIAARNSSK
jgi:TRAP-type uncharacterized transport system fused permease subunit